MHRKFDVLDDISFGYRSLLLVLCVFTCCWGFVNNAVLLILASKIGFPIAVVACAMLKKLRQVVLMGYYTLLMVVIGWLFFASHPEIVIDAALVKNFVPSGMDQALAIGLGFALGKFWHHPIRVNLIVMSAGLASLLPACVMAGYQFSHEGYVEGGFSLALYFQYVLGMFFGAVIESWYELILEKNKS